MPRIALLDGDIIAYQSAAWAHARGIDGLDLRDRVLHQAREWVEKARCKTGLVCFSCAREDNFRRDHWPEYKTHRDGHVDPPQREAAKFYLTEAFRTLVRPRIEADDIMGIVGSAMKDSVIVTTDKDLRQVPGRHLNPDKDDAPVEVSLEEADRWFYTQWMAGDATDNVPGLFRWGPAKAARLLDDTPREDWDEAVMAAYRDHPKGYDPKYAVAMARCVRVLRSNEWNPNKAQPILWQPRGFSEAVV